MTGYISPAKVNLFFRVLGKRPDHYHEIATLFAAVGIYDRIEISKSESDSFWCSDYSIPTDSGNRVIKALHLFRAKTEIFVPVSIDLVKAIPVKAGLGGGSSNASTTLYALNQLFDQPLSIAELQELGAKIGSDEAFFFTSGLAFGQGRGEILSEIEENIALNGVTVAMPDYVSLGTNDVFDACSPNDFTTGIPADILSAFFIDTKTAVNDLEQTAFRVNPEMKWIKEELINLGFSHAVMTGSGSAFVCYGEVHSPKMEGITFYIVPFLKREPESWYAIPPPGRFPLDSKKGFCVQ